MNPATRDEPAPAADRDLEDAVTATLLGTAVGDALGLPAEGMSPAAVGRRFGPLDRFRLLGRTGFVSDDTEQSALVAQSLARSRTEGGGVDVERCVRLFRWALVGWFLRLPFGIGLATIRACARALLGLKVTGVRSAGNGAAMRAPVLGAALRDRPELRRELGRRIAEVTHLDPRGVDGGLFAAELAALAASAPAEASPLELARRAQGAIPAGALADAVERALGLAAESTELPEAAGALGNSGFVMHSVPLAAFCFARWGREPLTALQQAILAGGDTDTTGAMVGAWCGALGGTAALPAALVERINDGPFGPTHLRGLGRALARGERPPRYCAALALLRNLALYPVVLAHGFRRLLPW